MNEHPMKILLIEDNRADASLIQEMLAAAGAELSLDVADRLSAGLERLEEDGFDVVLLDLDLPNSQGLETLARVRAAAPETAIVVTTKLDDDCTAIETMREGAQDYLIKGQMDGNLLVRSMCYAIERKRAEETIRHLAYHDGVTGLPNRALFDDRFDKALAHAQRDRRKLALLLIDLDNFKEVNDTLGHKMGDRVLRELGQRLNAALRNTDTVARWGGDEFIILAEIEHLRSATNVARTAMEVFAELLVLDGHEVQVKASIGTAVYPLDGSDADTLLRNADLAMYSAKEEGGGKYRNYNDTPQKDGSARGAKEGENEDANVGLIGSDSGSDAAGFLRDAGGHGAAR